MSNEVFVKLFGDILVSPSNGNKVEVADALNKKVVMIYFAAHWCGPCRNFTPILIDFYNNMKKKCSDFELVFVSLDRDDSHYKDYFLSDMPWLCTSSEMTMSDKNYLAWKYKATTVPHLAVVDQHGKVITADGRSEVQADPSGENFPWRPKPFQDIWPEEILSKKGKIASSCFDDKYLILYFSACWCPKGKKFTSFLSEAYTELKAENDNFELVFVSYDEDENTFNEYFEEMTFCALPFENREAERAVSKKFEIENVPSLVILGPLPEGGGDRPLISTDIEYFMESIGVEVTSNQNSAWNFDCESKSYNRNMPPHPVS